MMTGFTAVGSCRYDLIAGTMLIAFLTYADRSNHSQDSPFPQRTLHMTNQRTKSFPVSWEELHRTSKALAWRLLELGPFKGLIAVTRGGLVPAAIVARELEVRLIDTACISSYHGSQRGKLDVLKPSVTAGDGTDWLIVDDLVDTGETAKALRSLMPKAHFATVYAKPAGRPLVDTFVTEVSQDTWIFFPWDLEPQPSTPIIGQRS